MFAKNYKKKKTTTTTTTSRGIIILTLAALHNVAVMKKTFTNLTFKLPDVLFFFPRQKLNEVIVCLYLKFPLILIIQTRRRQLCIQITLINAIWCIYNIYWYTQTERQYFCSDKKLSKVNEHFGNKYWFHSNLSCLYSCSRLMFISRLTVCICIFTRSARKLIICLT